MKLYGIVGAGGFGREVMSFAFDSVQRHARTSRWELVFVVEDAIESIVNGVRLISAEQFLSDPREKFFSVAIADAQARHRIVQEFEYAGAKSFTVAGPNAEILASSTIGEGTIICPFATISANAVLGRSVHANFYSYVAHDCTVGNFVTLAPGSLCLGRIVIEDFVFVGARAVIRPSEPGRPMRIGRNAFVGMGAVVTHSVEPNTMVVGCPAKVVPSLSTGE